MHIKWKKAINVEPRMTFKTVLEMLTVINKTSRYYQMLEMKNLKTQDIKMRENIVSQIVINILCQAQDKDLVKQAESIRDKLSRI